ncbi:MAG: hypothetical protein HY072_02755 [Deltaproteobacteria bacterium]|nr:hypothetical protein [Deltaproteobacteria bacterium]
MKVVWKTESGRRYNINEVTMGEKNMTVYGMEQEETASKLETLVKQKKIIAMFGLISDNDISCSSLRVQGFTADGYVFKFNFEMGD